MFQSGWLKYPLNTDPLGGLGGVGISYATSKPGLASTFTPNDVKKSDD